MTRNGYGALVVGLALLSLSGVFVTVWLSWHNAREPEELSCSAWLDNPQLGRFRLTRCPISPMPASNNGRTCSATVGLSAIWRTRDPEMMRMTESSPAGRRSRQRFGGTGGTRDIVVDALANSEHWVPKLRDPQNPKLSIWVGVIPFFAFGLPLIGLVRKQRKWRHARLAWERTKGVVTDADKPTAF